MAAHDGVWNAPRLEGRHCPPEPFLDHGDRLLDPIEDIEPERHDVGIGRRLDSGSGLRFGGHDP